MAAALLLAGCAKVETSVSSLPETESSELTICKELEPTEEGLTVIRAGFGAGAETRSRIELNEARTAADVLWTAGDSFYAFFTQDGSSFYGTTFTTQDDGVTVASFTNPYGLDGYSQFHCFYPNKDAWGTYKGEMVFGFVLPAEQNAVAGGIEEGLNRAYAYADELTKDLEGSLTFHNLTSMVKFRLDGAVTSRVKTVTFVGSGSVAGDMVFRPENGDLTEYPGIHFHTSYSKVVLQGDFEAGKDYYIVLWPQAMNGFRMEFADDGGNSTTKYSDKAVTFERSRIKDFGTIRLGDEFVDLNDGSLDPVKYMSATEGTKPVTIAVIPEGFTKEELSTYEQRAKQGIDALFEVEPYKTYRNRFNVYILKVASRESGASVTDGNGNIITQVNTYFNVRWGEKSYGDMRADPTTVFEFVSQKCPDIVDGIHTINEVPIVMIINDSRYGGICSLYSDGRGYGMVPYTYEGDGITWSLPGTVATTDDPLPEPVTDEVMQQYSRQKTQADMDEVGGPSRGDWRNTLIHEFGGHCFGRLGDEYWLDVGYDSSPIGGHSWPVLYSLNLTHDPTAAPWKEDLLDRLDELKARDVRYGRIGTFQGAGGKVLFGRWRSEKISCMIDNRAYFSAWQRYLITQRIFTLSGDLESFSFESWLAKDVTLDPVRDMANAGAPGGVYEHRTYTPVGPLPPPILVEE